MVGTQTDPDVSKSHVSVIRDRLSISIDGDDGFIIYRVRGPVGRNVEFFRGPDRDNKSYLRDPATRLMLS